MTDTDAPTEPEPGFAEVTQALAQAREELTVTRAALDLMQRRQAEGYAVDFNDYPYQPKYREWSGSAGGAKLLAMVEAKKAEIHALFEHFCSFNERFRAIAVLPDPNDEFVQPFWENWWLPGLDACILYGLIATRAPKTYLEVGSGNSTRIVRRAIRDFGLSTRIISIDPNPTSKIDSICDEVIRSRCEEVPQSVFSSLEAGDMLFIDNSHRSFQSSDVTVFFTEILPGVPKGVIYGVHDIFLPWDYPADWEYRFYNEQYLFASYLLGGADGDELLLPGHYIYRDPAFSGLRNRLFLGSQHIDWLTSSFWMIRGGAGAST
jgi:hypothetical protein